MTATVIPRVYNDPLHFDFAGARQMLAQARQECDVLPQLTRKAVADEIATELALLTACFPHQNKGERQIFAKMLCEDVAELAPSVYALHRACRRLRQRFKFLPAIAEVLDELKASMKETQRLPTKLKAQLSDMQKELDKWEQDLPRLKQGKKRPEDIRAEEYERRLQELVQSAHDGRAGTLT